MLDQLKKNVCAASVWVLSSSLLHSFLLRSKVNEDYKNVRGVLTIIFVVLSTILVHELIHFAVSKIFGKGKSWICFVKTPLGLPTVGVMVNAHISKMEKILFYIMPFVILTVIPDVIFLFCSKVHYTFFFLAICNSAGCYYDIIDTLKAFQEH